MRSFLKESRAAGSVQHPNVVAVRQLVFDGNRYWLAMDLLHGWSVRQLLRALDESGPRIPIAVALSIARDAIRGVQAIHEAGLLHRNVTPDNLMIGAAGQLVVLDFGLAIWQHATRVRFTPPVEALDPVYSSPELRSRLPVDAGSDVYSLGALLDQLIPDRGDAPIALDAIIRRALDPDAGRRFASAQALEIALDLVSIREGWLVPPSYVAAYLNDVFRATGPRVPARDVDGTPPLERRAPSRQVLPRGRRGMVGVGAMLPDAQAQNDATEASEAIESLEASEPPVRPVGSRLARMLRANDQVTVTSIRRIR